MDRFCSMSASAGDSNQAGLGMEFWKKNMQLFPFSVKTVSRTMPTGGVEEKAVPHFVT